MLLEILIFVLIEAFIAFICCSFNAELGDRESNKFEGIQSTLFVYAMSHLTIALFMLLLYLIRLYG